MIRVRFPSYDFKTKEENGRELIFDPFRKSWLVLTPEEWVRQNFMQYLLQVKAYPAALIGIEREIVLGDLRKRFDIAVHDRSGQPWMLVECKAMDVPLTIEVLQQVMRYNQSLNSSFLVITNGSYTKCFSLREGFKEMADLPVFSE